MGEMMDTGFEVTAGIRDSLRWMVIDQAYRGGIEEPQLMTLDELATARSWSPEMRTAIAQLADLDAGHIKCWRDTQTTYG